MKLLISDPDSSWAEKVRKHFTQLNREADICANGKDCQLKIFKNNYDALILDFDTSSHSAIEVLKFIRLNHPSVRVILTIDSQKRLQELQISKEDFAKMGVSTLLVKPYSLDKIVETVEQQNLHSSWRNIIENDSLQEEEKVSLPDNEFTRIFIDSMSFENAAIFDLYIRLEKNKFLKIFNRGDIYNQNRLIKHFSDINNGCIYFKTRDRSIYINFMNDFIQRLAKKEDVPTVQKVGLAKALVEKYIEEVHTKGLHPQLIEEGKKACENIFEIIQYSKDLAVHMRDYQEHNDDQITHSFLTSFFSVMMAKSLKWKSSRTIEALALGGLLHDIGKLKLDRKIRDKDEESLTEMERIQFRKHPQYGVELLQKCEGITEAVLQIVYQHHELIDGTGYPGHLSGGKIYPLAKVVNLADAFTYEMLKKKTSPIVTLKSMISNSKQVLKYDPVIVKALITCFIKSDEK